MEIDINKLLTESKNIIVKTYPDFYLLFNDFLSYFSGVKIEWVTMSSMTWGAWYKRSKCNTIIISTFFQENFNREIVKIIILHALMEIPIFNNTNSDFMNKSLTKYSYLRIYERTLCNNPLFRSYKNYQNEIIEPNIHTD